MPDLLFEEFEKSFESLPGEIGTEGIHQVKPNDQQQKQQAHSHQSNDTSQQQYLSDLYGQSTLTSEQIEAKRQQELRVKRMRYEQIQRDIQNYRAKKQEEVSAYEVGQQGLKTARTQEEKQELWQEEQKKQEEKAKKQKEIMMPGSAQARSGERQQIMG